MADACRQLESAEPVTMRERAVLNVKTDTFQEFRKLAGQIQAETGESMTDDKTVRFLLRSREELVERITREFTERARSR